MPRENILQLLPDAVAPSKEELAQYWKKVAKKALVHLGRRPLKLVRHTHGVTFYHRGKLPEVPPAVHQLHIQKREGGEGVRLWVDGQPLVNNWTDHAPTENSGAITLTAGQSYPITMEFYDHGGGALAQLLWSSSCEPKAVIPSGQLFPAAPAPTGDAAQYNFESSAQGWQTTGGLLTGVASAADRAFAGSASLKVSVSGAAGKQRVLVSAPAASAGATVTFHLWFPAGSPLASVQPYLLQGAAGGWTWTGNWQAASALLPGQWNTIKVVVPSGAVLPLAELGIELGTSASWTGAVYVDAVGW